MQRTVTGLLLSLLLVVATFASAHANDWRVEGADRVVAISDIHGAYGAMVEPLQNVGVLDDNLAWAGGTSRLVIVSSNRNQYLINTSAGLSTT